ncbi:hypothetical protein B0H67DRAFT_657315 [Lasiosphaeris hirsuta]|uniref:Uncharacterized protein n=1 Tax=Lasiosphaeris hirsuta TaxID=260670 RepID=A0AA40AZ31_9PEZI|nr:hypothetical protein B0H67DRAFT_657315 [Lasiosphaeris hirsuta]
MADNGNNNNNNNSRALPQGFGQFQFGPEFNAELHELHTSEGWQPTGVIIGHDKLKRMFELAVEDGVRHGLSFAWKDASATTHDTVTDTIQHPENRCGVVQTLQATRLAKKGRVTEDNVNTVLSGDEELLARPRELRSLIPGAVPQAQPEAQGAAASPNDGAGPGYAVAGPSHANADPNYGYAVAGPSHANADPNYGYAVAGPSHANTDPDYSYAVAGPSHADSGVAYYGHAGASPSDDDCDKSSLASEYDYDYGDVTSFLYPEAGLDNGFAEAGPEL